MTLEMMTTFFGWMAVLNIGFLAVTALALLAMRGFAVGLHARMFGLDPETVNAEHFRFLANYKILTLFFAVAPYLALRLM